MQHAFPVIEYRLDHNREIVLLSIQTQVSHEILLYSMFFTLFPNGNLFASSFVYFVCFSDYISTKELLWLQQQRPELFQSPNRAISQLPAHQSPYHTMNVAQNYRPHQIHRIRRAASEYRPTNKNRKNGTTQRKPKSRYNRENYNSDTNSGQNLYSVASRKIEKRYGILGSGNFEIIRGGILPDEPTRRPKKKNKTSPESENSLNVDDNANENDESTEKKDDSVVDDNGKDGNDSNNSESDTDSDNDKPQANDEQNGNSEENADDEEENANNNPLDDTFEPLNLDIFGNQDPFAGLQSKQNKNVV